jgi:hypothetical protein
MPSHQIVKFLVIFQFDISPPQNTDPAVVIRDKTFVLFGLDGGNFSWKGVAYLFTLFFGALFTAAILSGPVYLVSSEMDSAIAQYVASKGICKIYERITLLTALASLPFFFRKCGIKSLVELGCNLKNVGMILAWACVGALFMAALTAGKVLFAAVEVVNNHGAFGALLSQLPKKYCFVELFSGRFIRL